MIDYKTAAAYIRVSTDDSDESKLVDIYRSVTEQGVEKTKDRQRTMRAVLSLIVILVP